MAGEWNHIIPTHPSDTSYRARQTRQILYVDPNGIQHSIKAVYWSPTSNSNDVKLIWLRDSTVLKVLVAGDTSVAIQYKPTADISVTDIGIFTAESITTRTAKIKVFHESGLCVAAVDGDVKTTGETLYELVGDKRDTVINATTLYAGQTYYIIYYGGQNSDWDKKFYPAYFQNSSGKGVYKEYYNNLYAEEFTITDVSENSQNFKPSMFVGVFNLIDAIFDIKENSWFSWYSGQSQVQNMKNGDLYKRTNVGSSYTFSGIVGNQTEQNHDLSNEDMIKLIGLPYNSMFVWCVTNIQGITKNNIYAKVEDTWNAPTVTYEGPSDTNSKTALLPGLVALYNANNGPVGDARVLCISGYSYQGYGPGYSIKMKSGYQNYVSSTIPETVLPSNPQIGDVHYFAQGVNGEEGIYKWFGNYWGSPNMYYETPFETDENVSNWLTLVGTTEDFLTKVGSVPDVNFLAADENTSRKYYLKINGNEV